MRQTLMAGGSTFAHLRARDGIAGAKAEKDDEDDKKEASVKAEKEKDDEDDDEDDDKKKAEKKDDDNDDDEKAEKKAADDEEDAAAPRSRRAKNGDDDDEEDKKDARASAARARERARCAAIFATKAAATRPDVAAHLAFGTDLPRSAVINTLKAVAAGEHREQGRDQRPDLRSRMGAQPRYEVGTDSDRPQKSGPEAFAARVKLADEKRRGLA
jgi:hypothetical protein